MHLPTFMKIFFTGGFFTVVFCVVGALTVGNEKGQIIAKIGVSAGGLVAATSLLFGIWSY
jgi:hypothetical protein